MNKEIIRKLKEQATSYTWNGTEVTEELDEEQFAELIIKECIDIAKHNVMNISTYADAEFVEKQIKTHFGMNNEY